MSKPSPKASSKAKQSIKTSAHPASEVEEAMIAKPSTRMAAILYDGMLILALLFLVGTLLTVIGTLLTMETGTESSQAQSLPTWYQNIVMTPSFVLTLVGFYGIFWRRGGQTLGMQTWRLKTVNNAGHLLTWGQSFKRILAACLMPLLFGIIGSLIGGSRAILLTSAFLGLIFNYVFCLFNRRGLAVQDMLSNTITLKMPKTENEGLWRVIRNRKQNK
ncbi:RDD family protein [Psychrobacter sp. APC 3426]|uniref:RDD family protein n=1 Tax=Psychrobacter sp. APC 3426 TaxID=3035177 RepID=UPI0025B47909|nr:RDD family protein [Psychrobacter sp. APC 3426]MDN3399031.1 RDD family protein [Psychrobacter sp. APC 3426]